MRLFRFGEPGKEKPGVLLPDGRGIDVSEFVKDYDQAFFETQGLVRLKTWVEKNAECAPRVDGSLRLGPPVCRPSKIVCIGLNYRDHAKETGAKEPREPVVFFKATSALSGPNDHVVIPKDSKQTDWEVELALVIEKKASYVSEEQALEYVAGYSVLNDYSEREYQKDRGGQWCKGKGCDTFAPFGPYLVTKDEVPAVNDLKLWLAVNGESKQNSSTSNLIFNVPFLISYLSRFMSLLPGDIISTGTPAGVGLGASPPQFLKPGDLVELGIEDIGECSQKVISFEQAQFGLSE